MISGRLLTLLPLTLLGLTACGDDDPAVDGGAYADSSAEEIARDAAAAMTDLRSARVVGTLKDDGEVATVDLAVSPSACRGSVSFQGQGKLRLRVVDGTSYFKGDDEFWRTQGGDDAGDARALVGDRWAFDVTEPGAFKDLCTLDTFIGGFADAGLDSPDTTVTGTKKVAGVETVELTFPAEKGKDGHAYVEVAEPHHLVRIVAPGALRLTFSDFGKPVKVKRPAPGERIDLSTIG